MNVPNIADFSIVFNFVNLRKNYVFKDSTYLRPLSKGYEEILVNYP